MFSVFSVVGFILSTITFAQGAAVNGTKAGLCPDGSVGEILRTSVHEGKTFTAWTCPASAVEPFQDLNPRTATGHTFNSVSKREFDPESSLTKRNWDLCNAPCTTYCDTPAGGGPNPYDCSTLASIQAGQGTFTIGPTGSVYISWGSCQTVQTNLLKPGADLVYCWDNNNYAGIVNYIAFNCQAQQNAHGGSCHFYNSDSVSHLQVQTV